MRAFALALVMIMTACNSWYKDGHKTVAHVVSTTAIAWQHARGALDAQCTDAAINCGQAGIVEKNCAGMNKCRQDVQTVALAIDAVYQAAHDSYRALEDANRRQGTVGRVAVLVDNLIRVARKLWAHLQERELWPNYLSSSK